MKRKSNQFSVRLDQDLQKSVEECVKLTGLDPALFMREAFKAFVEEVQRTGEVRLPLAIIPKSAVTPTTPSPPGKATVLPPQKPAQAAPKDRPSSGSAPEYSLNETPTEPVSSPGPRPQNTRAPIRRMVQREKSKHRK